MSDIPHNFDLILYGIMFIGAVGFLGWELVKFLRGKIWKS